MSASALHVPCRASNTIALIKFLWNKPPSPPLQDIDVVLFQGWVTPVFDTASAHQTEGIGPVFLSRVVRPNWGKKVVHKLRLVP